jgi:hypothetical protein
MDTAMAGVLVWGIRVRVRVRVRVRIRVRVRVRVGISLCESEKILRGRS